MLMNIKSHNSTIDMQMFKKEPERKIVEIVKEELGNGRDMLDEDIYQMNPLQIPATPIIPVSDQAQAQS
jgi:hypothetical protein